MTENSILTDIKDMLGYKDENYDAFDTEIILHINSALARLSQLGVDTSNNLQITSSEETWEGLFGDNSKLNQIQLFIFLKVKLVFDPPSSGTTTQSFENQVKELEWEINVTAEEEKSK